MKTKIYSFVLFCVVIMIAQNSNAQNCGGRYHDKNFFAAFTKTTVTYSTPYNLAMDVYEPTGDTASQRPVMILAHGGSFLQGSTKTSDTYVVNMCKEFAKRGYVTASIDYRVASFLDMLDSSKAVQEVLKAISDGKAAIRYFRKDAATTNTYRVNPNQIFVGGNSAGAVLYIHVMYLDSTEEAPATFQAVINANGGFEGNSGNLGYSSEATALINLAGGLNIPEFVGPNSKPSFNAQGDQDATVPYGCANAQSNATPVRLCGLGAIEPLYNQYAVNHVSIVYPGEGHVPWATGANAAAETAQIDSSVANFLMQFVCSASTSVNELKETAEISLFPNPANTEVNIRSSEKVSMVMVYDNIGQVVVQNNFENTNVKINTSNFAKGIYQVKIEFTDKNIATVTRKVVIE